MEGELKAAMLTVVPELERNNGNIFEGKPDVNRGRVQDDESITIDLRDFDLKVLSQDKQEQIKANLNRRITAKALNIKNQLSKPITKDNVSEAKKKLYTPTNRIGEARE